MSTPAHVLHNRLLARARFRHWQVLVRLAELGSVRKAAQAMGLTQPGVTQLLADLEGLLEVTLFQRHARGVWPTPACRDLLGPARQLLLGLSATAEAVTARQQLGQGLVRVQASTAAINGLLTRVLPDFGAQHPQIQLQVHEAEVHDQFLAVAKGEVDLSVCRQSTNVPQGWRFVPLMADEFAFICGPDHPLARRRKIHLHELIDAHWVISPIQSAARLKLDAVFEDLGATPRISSTITRVSSMTWAMLQGQPLLTLAPLSVFGQLLQAGQVVRLPVQEPMPFEPLGMALPEDPVPEATQRLAEALMRATEAASS